jgi:tRNA1Val (adenine37-N6)-methyltransferase
MIRTVRPVPKDETLDTFYHGRILVRQKKMGYRFSVDAPLLASFIRTEPGDELLELGTGCGIISLLLSNRPFRRITALEVQRSLASLAGRNVILNRLQGRMRVVRGDLRSFRPRKKYDVVFSNPPYLKGAAGTLSPSAEKSIAKHELRCDIFDVMDATHRLLKKGGRSYFIFPERRRPDFRRALQQTGLRLKRLRPVHSTGGQPACLFLAEIDWGAPRPRVLQPLVLFGRGGGSTAEARRIFAGGRHA